MLMSIGARCFTPLDRRRNCLQMQAQGTMEALRMISSGNRPGMAGPSYGAGPLPAQSGRTSISLARQA
eukprot:4875328-Pyramimonas_sp.AAC.1